MFLDPWPTLNLHLLFPKRAPPAHHKPAMGLGWGAVTDSSFLLSHIQSITAYDALHRGDCPTLRVILTAGSSKAADGARVVGSVL